MLKSYVTNSGRFSSIKMPKSARLNSVFNFCCYYADQNYMLYACVVICMQSTSIRIQQKTRESLSRLKKHPRESFDDVITRLIDANADDEPLSEETIQAIEKSLKEYREGIYYTHEEILADLGISETAPESGVCEAPEEKYPAGKKPKKEKDA